METRRGPSVRAGVSGGLGLGRAAATLGARAYRSKRATQARRGGEGVQLARPTSLARTPQVYDVTLSYTNHPEVAASADPNLLVEMLHRRLGGVCRRVDVHVSLIKNLLKFQPCLLCPTWRNLSK